MKIISVVTTKNRIEFFKSALDCVSSQSRTPDEIIVVSDSSEQNKNFEKQLASSKDITFLENCRTKNYAGSLNMAMHHIIEKSLFDEIYFSEICIAFLDDDDKWNFDYLEKCEKALNGKDFVISGITHCNDEGKQKLSIPNEVSLESFLRKNPHLQGSNTFIRFSTLLRAGLFDENLSSTIDRDIFARVMLLNPTYTVLNEHLVEVNASDSYERVTNNRKKKADGLGKFYRKYKGFMSEKIESAFFERIKSLFNLSKEEILYHPSSTFPTFKMNSFSKKYTGHLTIAFIATEYECGLRLLHQLIELKRPNTKIVILLNFTQNSNLYFELLNESGYDFEFIDKTQILNRLKNGFFDQFVTPQTLQGKTICDIATARTVLQRFLFEITNVDDVVWILDDDVELVELVQKNDRFEKIKLDIDEVIALYKNNYDAVIGNYSLDAPLPLLSTLRTSLLDFVYAKVLPINERTFSNFKDYYYDLSDCNGVHLETPFPLMNENCNLDDVFSGKATSRALFNFSVQITEAKNRGGNTLIFNHELLNIPNWSIKVNGITGRRSDYFWVLQAKNAGYSIKSAPFSVLHNRRAKEFDMQREQAKFLSDLIGSSFTKAIEKIGITGDAEQFFAEYKNAFVSRLAKFVTSYYRISGLLFVIGDKKYSKNFNIKNLNYFISKAQDFVQNDAVICAYETLKKNLRIQFEIYDFEKIRKRIEKYFGLPEKSLRLLGIGSESMVLTDDKKVYKFFFKPLENYDFLRKISENFCECEQCYQLDFFCIEGKSVIRYEYENSVPYKSGHARELAAFISFAKKHGFSYKNYIQRNFVVANGKLKLIDYGKSFLPHTQELYEKSIVRSFQMLRYHFLRDDDFRRLIFRDYNGEAKFLNYGKDVLKKFVEQRYKEDLHDKVVLKILAEKKFDAVLDYGAGKCKIANALAKNHKVTVFDIDKAVLQKSAGTNVKIIENAECIPNASYDLVLNNLVFCCVDDFTANEIVKRIVHALKIGGTAIVSFCNPFFNSIKNTELRTTGLLGNYNQAEKFKKHATIGKPIRVEFHRPLEFYLNLLERNGLSIQSAIEGDGVDMDTLLPIAEHIILDCKKTHELLLLEECSLLIKTCPMEYRSIYRNIKHIVCTLENGGQFARRIVVADFTDTEYRAKQYDVDNREKLIFELERLKLNGLIDEIIFAEQNDKKIKAIYKKYFDTECCNGHSANGQGLYATLLGFESVKTKYVFQSDSDILYHNGNIFEFLEGLQKVRNGAITATIGIASNKKKSAIFGKRTEVRSCFLNLQKLKMQNPLKNATFALPWHRALDKVLLENESVRLCGKDVFFVHPENCKKAEANFVSYAQRKIAQGEVPPFQFGNVNLQGEKSSWTQKIFSDVVVYIRGRNTPPEKLKRMFDSLKNQTFQNFKMIYIDDASENESSDYAEFIFRYDKYFHKKVAVFFNDENVGTLSNFVFAMKNIVANENAIVINLDSDDFFVNEKAIEKIVKEFENGAEITCGNCIRYDKPLKRYEITSFENLYLHSGGNIWLHPKCFRRYLFDFIDIENDLKIDGKFVDVNTDFAFMLPMIEHAKKKVFIKEILYFFEPSEENIKRCGKYEDSHKAKVKEILLEKARRRNEKNRCDNRGQQNRSGKRKIQDSFFYGQGTC